jgi:recombination protein RecA
MALEDKIVDKSGAWLNYGNMRLGQGRENAKQFLRDNPALVEEITQKILAKRGIVPPPAESEPNNGRAEEASPRGRKQPAAAE